MESKLYWEVETLRDMLKAGIEALEEIEKTPSGLTRYGRGYRDSHKHIIDILDRILEEVSK